MTSLRHDAEAILRQNDRGGYSVPTDGLYPFQWNWDAGFAAMGYATFDEARGWQELDRLLEGQWDDGMVPHIVFHQDDPRYFPGPEVWGVERTPRTSGITQPPILAVAARRMLETAGDQALAEAAARRLYPKLLASHRWFHTARDPRRSGLVATLHPWETGMDNSPAWDGPLARTPVDELPPYERRDTGHVEAGQRPHKHEYDRYLSLVLRFRARGWDPKAMFAHSPFRVIDVATNAILHRADRDLLHLATAIGVEQGKEEVAQWLSESRNALDGLWSDEHGIYLGRDDRSGEPLPPGTSAGFLPLFAEAPDAERTKRLIATLEAWLARVRYGVPSADPASPSFEPRRYWRGPVWLIVNWMIAQGLAAARRPDLAERLRRDSRELVEKGSLHEYFDPNTGEALGGGAFTWTAAVTLFWLLGEG